MVSYLYLQWKFSLMTNIIANGPDLNACRKVLTYHEKQIWHVITNYYETAVTVEMASYA